MKRVAVAIGFVLLLMFALTHPDPENTLVRPVFAEEASFLAQEAGMSAYTNVGSADLSKAKNAFKIIEKETQDYLIGLISLPGLGNFYDVHCYIQKDGWIVAYYMKDAPASKIFGKKYYGSEGGENNLKDAIDTVCRALGKACGDIKYYHFAYPEANKMVKITGKEFRFKIPGDFTVYEASLVGDGEYGGYRYYIYFDGKVQLKLSSINEIGFVTINVLDLTPDEFHSAKFGSAGSAVLIYHEP